MKTIIFRGKTNRRGRKADKMRHRRMMAQTEELRAQVRSNPNHTAGPKAWYPSRRG